MTNVKDFAKKSLRESHIVRPVRNLVCANIFPGHENIAAHILNKVIK